ncbi:MAG: hypothetical protein AAGJ46_08830 [Planctomycetota bacterium]
MPGLRELLGLPEPTPPPDLPAGSGRARLAKAIKAIGDSLRSAAASAPEESLIPLRVRRSQLVTVYQRAEPGSAELKQALKDAAALAKDALALTKQSRADREKWESQSGKLEQLEERIADGDPKQAGQLKKVVDSAKAAADRRDFAAAVAILSGKAKPGAQSASGKPAPVNEQRFELASSLPKKPRVPTSERGLAKWDNPLIEGDPRELFDPADMKAVVDMNFQGQGSPELNQAMEAILFAEPGADVTEHAKVIARERGLSEEVALDQLKRFRQLQEVSSKVGQANGLEEFESLTTRRDEFLDVHGDFLGTRNSLRFGQVVGEATGLDPAFASMLNPTGGMVGPGMDILAPADAESPVVYHGIFHDAGGYLLNHQNAGPGYTYWGGGPPTGEPGADPLHGQADGISRWYEMLAPDRSVFEDLYLTGKEEDGSTYDQFVKDPIDNAEEWVDDLTGDALGGVAAGAQAVAEESAEKVDSLQATTQQASEEAQQAIQSASAAVDKAAAAAKDAGLPDRVVDAAQKMTKGGLEKAGNGVEALEDGVVAGLESAGAAIEGAFEGMASWATSLAELIDQKTDDMADAAEQAIHEKLVAITSSPEARPHTIAMFDALAEVSQTVTEARKTIETALDEAEEAAGKIIAAADAGNSLLEALGIARQKAEKATSDAARGIQSLAQGAALAGQELMDAAVGVGDSMEGVVDSGVDTFSNIATSATDEASDSLEQQTSLLD